MNLREHFEKLHPTPDGVYWRGTQGCFCYDEGCHDIPEYLEYVSKWQGFQSGHAAGLEAAAKFLDEWNTAIGDDLAKSIRAMKDQSHSANTVGGPTPGAAPACERKE